MKTIFIILSILFLSGSCRSIKERHDRTETNTTQQALTRQHRSYMWTHADSAIRYWYYSSDSNFFYHPDYGLQGQGGKLWISEDIQRYSSARADQDSITYDVWSENRLQEKSRRWSERRKWAWAIPIAAAGILLLWLLRKIYTK